MAGPWEKFAPEGPWANYAPQEEAPSLVDDMIRAGNAGAFPGRDVFPPLLPELTDLATARAVALRNIEAAREESLRQGAANVEAGGPTIQGMTSADASRSLGEVAQDALSGVRRGGLRGVAVGAELPVNALNLAAYSARGLLGGDAVWPDFAAVPQPQWIKDFAAQARADAESEPVSIKEGLTQREQADIARSGEGFFPQLGAQLGYTARNPGSLVGLLSEQVGQMWGGGVIPGASLGTQFIAQGLQAAGMNAAQVRQALEREGIPPEEADRTVTEVFGLSFAANAMIPQLVPGGAAIEKLVAGQVGRGVTGAGTRLAVPTLGEGLTEGLAEGVDTGIANWATGRPLMEGTGAATGMGFAVGAPLGSAAGATDALAAGARDRRSQAGAADVVNLLADAGLTNDPAALARMLGPSPVPAPPPISAPGVAQTAPVVPAIPAPVTAEADALDSDALESLLADPQIAAVLDALRDAPPPEAQATAVPAGRGGSPAPVGTDSFAPPRALESRAAMPVESRGENNASGESAASLEAIGRLEEERALGRDRLLIDRDGTVRPLFGVDAVDTFARPGQVIVQRGIGRDPWTVLSADTSLSQDQVAGKINAAQPALASAALESRAASEVSRGTPMDPPLAVREAPPLEAQEAVRTALGPAGRHVEVLPSPEGLPPDVRARLAPSARAEGVYDPETGKAYVFADARMTLQRAVWVAYHETAGHLGLRGAALKMAAGDRSVAGRPLVRTLDNAGSHPTIAALTAAIRRDSPDYDATRATEEALAELAAAVRTGDYSHLSARYGVTIPAGQRAGLRGMLARLVDAVRAFLRKMMGKEAVFTDADVYRLLEDAWSYAKTAPVGETGRGGVRAQESREAQPFFSALARAIDQAKGAPKRADGTAWKGWLDGAQRRGEFKQAERDWLGVDAWLDSRPTTTREELAEFVRANEVRVEDVVLGQNSGQYNYVGDEWQAAIDRAEAAGDFNEAERINRAWEGLDEETGSTKGMPKFAERQLPGGRNYRELLLTFPDANDTYASPHYEDHANVLAHVRFNERTADDGKRVLFLEEIQSDRHQTGRKKGYAKRGGDAVQKLIEGQKYDLTTLSFTGWIGAAMPSEYANAWDYFDSDGVYLGPDANGLEPDFAATGRISEKVPDAPFKATDEWAMLAFKRMARWAVDNGFDRVAWTTGAQQAARYDLSKQVDKIAVIPMSNGGRAVRIEPKTGTSIKLMVDKDGNVSNATQASQQFNGKKLDEVVGKDMADKIMSATEDRTFTGVELSVGGEGMRAFYDKILPLAVNKWAKRFGGKVRDVQLDRQNGQTNSLDITPAMREAVAGGQPLFSRVPADEPKKRPPDIRRYDTDPPPVKVGIIQKELDGVKKRFNEIFRSDRPKNPQAITERVNNVRALMFDAMMSKAAVLKHQYPESRGLRQLMDTVFTEPGSGKTIPQTMLEAVQQRYSQFNNRWSNVLGSHGLTNMTKAQNVMLRDAMLGTAERVLPNIQSAADALRVLMDVQATDARTAGLEFGEVTDVGYLTRLYDDARITESAKSEAEFLADARLLFRDHEFPKEIGPARGMAYERERLIRFVQAARQSADPKVQAALERMAQALKTYRATSDLAQIRLIESEIGAVYDRVAEAYAQRRAAAWLHGIKTPNMADGFAVVQSPGAPMLKDRVLSAAADTVMARWMITDIPTLLDTYGRTLSRKIESAARFGPTGNKIQDMLDTMIREGVPTHDVVLAGRLAATVSGQLKTPAVSELNALADWLHALGYVALLDKAVIASIAEPITSAIRTGDLRTILSPLVQVTRSVRRAAGIPTARGKEVERLAKAIGVAVNAGANAVLMNQLGGDYALSPRPAALLTRFFEATLLTALTQSQRIYVTGVADSFLRGLARSVAGGKGSVLDSLFDWSPQQARAEMADLGIADPDGFANWLLAQNGTPDPSQLFDPSGRPTLLGQDYMAALGRFVDQVIQNPNAGIRPELASAGPLARLMYGITSFVYSFYENLGKGSARRIALIAKRDGWTTAVRTAALTTVPAFVALAVGQTLVSTLRELLLNPERWEDMEDEERNRKLLLLGLSRSFGTGSGDRIIQYLTGLKYRRSAAEIVVGPSPGFFLGALDRITGLGSEGVDSDPTSTQKYRAAQALYNAVLQPTLNVVLSYTPAGPITKVLPAAGIIVGGDMGREPFARQFGMSPQKVTELDERYTEARKELKALQAEIDGRVALLPKDQWAREFEALKAEYPGLMEGARLDVYVDNAQNRRLGRAGMPKMDRNGGPAIRLEGSDGGSILGELEGYTRWTTEKGRPKAYTTDGINDHITKLNSVISTLREDRPIALVELQTLAPTADAVAELKLEARADLSLPATARQRRAVLDELENERRALKREAVALIERAGGGTP